MTGPTPEACSCDESLALRRQVGDLTEQASRDAALIAAVSRQREAYKSQWLEASEAAERMGLRVSELECANANLDAQRSARCELLLMYEKRVAELEAAIRDLIGLAENLESTAQDVAGSVSPARDHVPTYLRSAAASIRRLVEVKGG